MVPNELAAGRKRPLRSGAAQHVAHPDDNTHLPCDELPTLLDMRMFYVARRKIVFGSSAGVQRRSRRGRAASCKAQSDQDPGNIQDG